jgi:hypothetical protein
MDSLTDDDNPDNVLGMGNDCRIDGANLYLIEGDRLTVDYVDGESATHTLDLTSAATPAADGTSLAVATANKFTGATSGQNVTFTLVSHGGQAGTRAQTNTLTVRLVS